MAKFRSAMLVWCFVPSVALLSPAGADEASDLADLKSQAAKLRGETESLSSESNAFLTLSRELRSKDETELAELINGICRQDIEVSGDDAERLANDLIFDAVSEISQSFAVLEDRGDELKDDLEDLMNSLKSTIDRYDDLEDSDEFGDEAEDLIEQVEKDLDTVNRRYSEINQDYQTLLNVQNGVMKGSNNPRIRASLDYGKEMHKRMQDSLGCDDREVSVSGGRADCVKFDSSYGCLVIEIKPDTYSDSEARYQAERYISGLKTMYKDNEKAKQYCKMDSSGNWEFTAKAESYPACKP